jgi:hypothetical protein
MSASSQKLLAVNDLCAFEPYDSVLRSLELRPGERIERLLRCVSRSGLPMTQRRTLGEFPNAAKRPEALHVGSQSHCLLCFRSALEGKLALETEGHGHEVSCVRR